MFFLLVVVRKDSLYHNNNQHAVLPTVFCPLALLRVLRSGCAISHKPDEKEKLLERNCDFSLYPL